MLDFALLAFDVEEVVAAWVLPFFPADRLLVFLFDARGETVEAGEVSDFLDVLRLLVLVFCPIMVFGALMLKKGVYVIARQRWVVLFPD